MRREKGKSGKRKKGLIDEGIIEQEGWRVAWPGRWTVCNISRQERCGAAVFGDRRLSGHGEFQVILLQSSLKKHGEKWRRVGSCGSSGGGEGFASRCVKKSLLADKLWSISFLSDLLRFLICF